MTSVYIAISRAISKNPCEQWQKTLNQLSLVMLITVIIVTVHDIRNMQGFNFKVLACNLLDIY